MTEKLPPDPEALTGEDRELLEFLLAREQPASQASDRIQPKAGTLTPPPLSFGQRRLWVVDQLDTDPSAYTITLCLRALGPLDRETLAKSLSELARRHEALRTRFPAQVGNPIQEIAAPAPIPLPCREILGDQSQSVAAACQGSLAEALAEPFDLARGPLFRARLLKFGPDDHAIVLIMHHIVTDAWSNRILLNELLELYSAASEGRDPVLPALPITYADYAAWQHDWLESDDFQHQLRYWKDQLAGAPDTLDLPTDKPRPAVQSFSGARKQHTLSLDLSDALQAFGQSEGATLFMTLLAAFATLLHRYSAGQEDMVIGTPIAGRNRVETEGLVGFFVNSLALRTSFSGDPSFRELLGRVRRTALDAFQHQDLPFERLVEELAPDRDLTRTPLFQIMFALQNAPTAGLEQNHLELSIVSLPLTTARFDLEVHAWQTPQGLSFSFICCTDLFAPETVERMVGHYETLLRSAVSDPDVPVSALEMLAEDERARLLGVLAGQATAYPRDRTIPGLFEAVAASRPEAPAVTFGDDLLSYGELERRANRLAHYLQGLGVGPEVPVGLCLERGLELVVAVLAILKAGGAYVPLDPDYPEARLSYMLADSAAPLLVTEAALQDRVSGYGGRVVCLDLERTQIAQASAARPEVALGARSLAYIIYTSGSTGRPKGTRIEHRSVVRLVRDTNYVELGPDEVILQFAPISFDASTFEIWGALLNGARLAVMAPGVPSLEELAGALRGKGVTTLWLTAALFHQMVDAQLEALAGVRQVLAGGEALSVAHVRKMLGALPAGHRLINGYGPTENTTFTACHGMTGDSEIGRSVPIGRPIANSRVYVLDGHRQPVPRGVAGELYIGGDGLARDYLNQPELTAEKFVADPFSDDPEARLYRTGDRVRHLADGTLEFLGRLDDQLKLRGFRIEPGEIEAILGEHPSIGKSVVILREDQPGDKRLVAYFVVKRGETVELEELRGFLRARLPAYMVPSAFVELESLPLTPIGKIDRAVLPIPDQGRDDGCHANAAPESEIERALAGQWLELLNVERIGRHDDFFDLGGHSLIATQAVSRIRSELETEITLAEFFQHPSVSALAELIENRRWARAEDQPARNGADPGAFEEGEL